MERLAKLTQKIQQILKKDKQLLGRWRIEYCDHKINNKIDWSNEDHCGPCGQYILQQQKLQTNLNPENKNQ